MVKNHLTRLIKQDNVGVDITKDKWNQIVEIIESSEADLDTNVYIHHFWLSRYQYTSAQKLFALLKRQVKRPEIAEMFLDDLLTDSETYRIINEPDFRKSWERGEDRVRGALDALKLFRVEQPLPMILSIMREYFVGHLSKTHARDILGAIENFHFVFTAITSQRSSGGISSMYALHARDLLSAQTQDQKVRVLRELKGKLRAKRPSFDEFKANFRELLYSDNHTKQKKLVSYVLARLDSKDQKGIPVNYSQMTIEHIKPQRPMNAQNATETYAKIGNLLLVSEGLNGKLSNKSFLEKKKLLISAGIFLDAKLNTATSWDDVEIDDRTDYLAELAYNTVWPL